MGNIFADAAAFLYQPVKAVLGAFTPIFIGLMLSYILNPAVDWLCRYMKRGWAILVTYLSVLFCIAGLTYGFVVLIIGSLPSGGISETVNLVYNYFVQSAEAVTGFFRQHFPSDWLPSASESMAGIQSWFRKLLSWGSVDFSSLRNMISKFSGHIVSSVLGIIASVYLLKDKDFFIRTWNALMSLILPQKIHGQLCELWFEGEGDAELPDFEQPTMKRRVKLMFAEYPSLYYCFTFAVYEGGEAFLYEIGSGRTVAVPAALADTLQNG